MTCALDNSGLFEQLKNGSTVVVPDAGYAVNLKHQFSNWVANYEAAWQAPLIFSWHDWLKQLWLQQQRLSSENRIILNDIQQRLLWQRVIEMDISGHTDTALWNLNASVKQARNAWALIHDYCLDLTEYPRLVNDVRVFIRWQKQYADLLAKNEWIDPLQIAQLLINSGIRIKADSIDVAGFERLTPLQTKFFKSVYSLPELIARQPKNSLQNSPVVEYPDIDAELTASAQWAREIYESDSFKNIGILVADLNKNVNKVETVFKSVFVPDFALDTNQEDVFFVRHNNKLVDNGLVNSALNSLGLLAYRFEYELFSRFLIDNYFDRDEQLRHNLCLLDIKLRRIVNQDVSLADMIELLERLQQNLKIDVYSFIGQLQTLNNYRKSLDNSVSIISWCDHFAAALKILKWPEHISLSPADEQSFKQWDQLFASVCTAGLVNKQFKFSEALNLFKDTAGFISSKNRQVRITIADINDCGGMFFDAAWICGLSDKVLPRPITFNPLLPFQLQRDNNLPFSSSADCQIRADAQFQQLSKLATELRFSYYKNDDHLSFRASHTLANCTLETAQPAEIPLAVKSKCIELETYMDDTGVPLKKNNAIGGSYLLKSQAQCPFKAYAEMRLNVDPIDKPELGLDPAQRGTLVHQVLHKLWQRLASKSALMALSNAELDVVIHQEVDNVVASLHHAQKLFVDIETKRLRDLAFNWLTLEMSRAKDFRISSMELPLTYSLAGIEFKLKVDRIDMLEDGSLLVIDYKTGSASKSSWLDQRVQDPQMPIYYFAVNENLANNVAAISFANTKKLIFDGLSDADISIRGIVQVENNNRGKLKNYENFEQLIQHWSRAIDTLVNELKMGMASVTPETLSNCKYCGRQSLCRINQHQSLV